MTQNHPHQQRLQFKVNTRTQRHPHAQVRPDADTQAILREMAFVLKMTQRVHDEIETDQLAHEAMMA